MEFTTTERGARKLSKDGYIYLLKKKHCKWNNLMGVRTQKKGECRASIKQDELDNFVEQVNDHSHPPLATSVKQLR